jgi:hypothetical protein
MVYSVHYFLCMSCTQQMTLCAPFSLLFMHTTDALTSPTWHHHVHCFCAHSECPDKPHCILCALLSLPFVHTTDALMSPTKHPLCTIFLAFCAHNRCSDKPHMASSVYYFLCFCAHNRCSDTPYRISVHHFPLLLCIQRVHA